MSGAGRHAPLSGFFLPEGMPASRLDKVLSQHLGQGLRFCRELVASGRVTVNGKQVAKGTLVVGGQHVCIRDESSVLDVSVQSEDVPIVARSECFVALRKPAGMHSVAGRGAYCLEALLPTLGLGGWQLVNRLDLLTSGMVLAARSARDVEAYAVWQERGLVRKWYLARVWGRIEPGECRSKICDARRRTSRVLAEDDLPLRWTWVWPMSEERETTTILARILRGRRHQIRVHLAACGHPLLGDPVYGGCEAGGLFLHHAALDMPGFTALDLPVWGEKECMNRARAACEAAFPLARYFGQ